ncbi:MAG TPA: AAA family ATPase [Vicinamibacterales bacterium]|nr:AAA family ATPase [Vicinamibacterales bacterium]
MYEQFFGLAERPFDLTPNPRYLLLTPSHREALANLDYGISSRKGLIVVIGEAGTGKTTLLRRVILKGVNGNGRATAVKAVYLANPTLNRREFVEYLSRGFGLSSDAGTSKTRLLFELEEALIALRRANASVALIIDEAQSLPHELMEEVRLLANIESDTEKLLPVVLVGQPELALRLNERPLRQLKQRVSLRCRLDALDLHQTAAYIAHRVTLAGGDPASIFSREAVIAVYERSRGIPRSINVVCDNALLSGFALDRKPIGSDIVAEVGDDFDLTPEAASSDNGESESAVARFLREGEDEDAEGSRNASDDERHPPLRWREQERRAR